MNSPDDDIARFLSSWEGAEMSGDAGALEAALADDFIAFGPLGFALPKEDWLERHNEGSLRYEAFELPSGDHSVLEDRMRAVLDRRRNRPPAISYF